MIPIIIIGSGLAAHSVARNFRQLNKETPVMIITADSGDYYSKPMLSSALAQHKNSEQLVLARPDLSPMTLLTNTNVVQIDLKNKVVHTDRGEFAYDRLVMATGAHVIQPTLKGDAVGDVLSVNSLDDYRRFREKLIDKKRIVIMGGGLIGCEFTNDLLRSGLDIDVTVIDLLNAPLQQLIPPEIGARLQDVFKQKGVRWHLGAGVSEVNRADAGFSVVLSNGHVIEADLILSAIGLRSDSSLAKSAGLSVNRGIVANRYLETSDPHVYALGDCAEVEGHVLRYTKPLFEAAKALAKTLGGERTAVQYPVMTVSIKTPDYPITFLPPPMGLEGTWSCESQDDGETALFHDASGVLRGFVLTRDLVKQAAVFSAKVPGLV